jgi:hypothetical protein
LATWAGSDGEKKCCKEKVTRWAAGEEWRLLLQEANWRDSLLQGEGH